MTTSMLTSGFGPTFVRIRAAVWEYAQLKWRKVRSSRTCQATRVSALRPLGPVRQLAVDRALHNTGSIHLPSPLQAQLQNNTVFIMLYFINTMKGFTSRQLTSLQNLRSTDLPSLRTQSSMRVLKPLPHTALSLSWQVLQSVNSHNQ